MVIGDDVGISVLGLVGLQVRMFPGELLPRVNGLQGEGELRHGRQGCGVAHQARGIRPRPTAASAHLVLLGELEAVVGFEPVHVLGHV